jgi:hypothetical protein
MAKDTSIKDWSDTSSSNSPKDSDRIKKDFADQIRNIKSVSRSLSLDKAYHSYSYGSDKDYVLWAGSENPSDFQGSSIQSLDITSSEFGWVSMSLVGDQTKKFPPRQRIIAFSSGEVNRLMGTVLTCQLHSNNTTVLTINWDELAWNSAFKYEEDMRPSAIGAQQGYDASPFNGMSGKTKIYKDDSGPFTIYLRTFGWLDPNLTNRPADARSGQVIATNTATKIGFGDPAVTSSYTSDYFVSLQVNSTSQVKNAAGEDGAGLPNSGATIITRTEKHPDKFLFYTLDTPGSSTSDKYVIWDWSISYPMRGM